jgi:hypothetical protein
MGFLKGIGPRRCPGCREYFDVRETKMVKFRERLYCPPCAKRLKIPSRNSKKLTARSVAR